MKRCSQCKQESPRAEFPKRRGTPDGFGYLCRGCARAASRKLYNARYRDDPAFRAKRAAYFKAYRGKDRAAELERNRRSKLRINYGLGIEEFDAMNAAQQGRCAICGNGPSGGPENARKKYLSVDHDHKTGRLRALLCDECNIGLGKFKDSPELLATALAYLLAYDKETVDAP